MSGYLIGVERSRCSAYNPGDTAVAHARATTART
jgi:hypothetical protein